ncbi:MAG: DUF4403 family protein [Bacteroidetes bacterium]|nr:MAG: DUF4403 family protein [Bacteroidota bacterium]
MNRFSCADLASILLVLSFVLVGCFGGKKAQQYSSMETSTQDTSVIVIPVTIVKSELEKNINDNLPSVLYEGDSASEGLAFRASKRDSITVDFSNDTVLYNVPINFWFRKSLAITSVTGQGALEVSFRTHFVIDSLWNLNTETQISAYRWIEKPAINIGFASIPVTPIVDYILEKSKNQIATSIDTLIKEQFNLRQTMEETWLELQQPIFLSEEYNTWLLLNPTGLKISPIRNAEDSLVIKAFATAKPRIFVGPQPPAGELMPLPAFENSEPEANGFALRIKTSVDFEEATRITRMNLAGESFDFGRRTVKVEDIHISGKGNQLAVRTTLSGSYNGDIVFVGKPEYNLRKNKIRIEKLKVDFSSKKKLLKTAAWLFKGKLKKEIENSLNAYLEEYLTDLYTELEETLKGYELAPGIVLTGSLGEVELSKLYVSVDAINFQISLEGETKVSIGQ